MLKRLLVSSCAMTRTTDLLTRRLGAGYFLPELFVLRYSLMGRIEPETFADQLAGARSFRDHAWCGYWNEIAQSHEQIAMRALDGLPDADELERHVRAACDSAGADFDTVVDLIVEHYAEPSDDLTRRLEAELGAAATTEVDLLINVGHALHELLQTMTYYQVSAFPGDSPSRIEAYWKSREIFALVGPLLAPLLSMTVEETVIEVAGEAVRVHALFPANAAKAPLVLATNGLEGTVQELVVPLLSYRRSGMGMVVMEMPGSYAYTATMAQGENIYGAVIDHFRSDPRVDPDRIGMVGVSFGGYWSTRMAAVNPNLACAVACGAPVHRTFTPTGSLGVPEVIVSALMKVTGTRNPASLLRALRRMSLLRNGLLDRIHIPLLVINGENDTLISPRDAPLLAARVPHAELQLYPGDDHCAMGHYREWMDQSFAWISTHLADSSAAKDRNGSL